MANRIKTAKKLVAYAREKIMLNLQLQNKIQRLAPFATPCQYLSGMNMSFLRSAPSSHNVGHLSPIVVAKFHCRSTAMALFELRWSIEQNLQEGNGAHHKIVTFPAKKHKIVFWRRMMIMRLPELSSYMSVIEQP
jgi:hypothetical protein